MNTFIMPSTMMKSNAFDIYLQSARDHNYAQNYTFVGVDDYCGKRYIVKRALNPHNPCWDGVDASVEELEMPSSIDIYEKHKPFFKDLRLIYHKSVPRQGISIIKNAGLLHAQQEKADAFMGMDDDTEFIAPGLIEELISIQKSNNLPHITGQWTEDAKFEKQQLQGGGWLQNFPIEAEGDRVTWHKGSHGCAAWFSMDLIKKVGFYNKFPGRYSYEHSLMTARCMKMIGRTPLWHPQHSRAWKYYIGQRNPIPNNYFDTAEDIKLNDPYYWEVLKKVYQGIDVVNMNHGINWKDWTILT